MKIFKWVLLIFIVATILTHCFHDRGKLAVPKINPHPTEAVHVIVKELELPPWADPSKYTYKLTATYQSDKLICGVIHNPEGWVETPRLDVVAKKISDRESVAYRDYVLKDECDWKLTILDVTGYEGRKKMMSAGVPESGTRFDGPRIVKEGIIDEEGVFKFMCPWGEQDSIEKLENGGSVSTAGGRCENGTFQTDDVKLNSIVEITRR